MENLCTRTVHLARAALFLAVAGCANTAIAQTDSVVFFPTNSSVLTPHAHQVVQRMADRAIQARATTISVEGHADGVSTRDATLAYERGRTVYQALQVAGVDPRTIRLMQGAPRQEAMSVEAHKAVVRFER
jgi:outer membrane protein OmpA-like peptidoglycan-associated protein